MRSAVLFAVLAAPLFLSACDDGPAADQAKFDPSRAIKVSAGSLSREWADNPVTASTKYKDRQVQISGQIASIMNGTGGDAPMIVLYSPGTETPITATLRSADDASGLHQGAMTTLNCTSVRDSLNAPAVAGCVAAGI